jgi:hypothetical protein
LTARAATPRTIDYTRMELGRVTRTARDGRRLSVIARCTKCGRRGERSASIPKPEDRVGGGRPYVSVDHVAVIKSWGREVSRVLPGFPSEYRTVSEHCAVSVDATNVDDLLNVEERRRYTAWVAMLRAYVEQY